MLQQQNMLLKSPGKLKLKHLCNRTRYSLLYYDQVNQTGMTVQKTLKSMQLAKTKDRENETGESSTARSQATDKDRKFLDEYGIFF